MRTVDFILKHDAFFEILIGFAAIFAGDLIVNLFLKGKKTTPFMRILLCSALCCGISVVKELAEFFCDFFFEGTELQDYSYVPEPDIFLFQLFGTGTNNAEQYHVMDTDFDFIFMLLGCAAGGSVLLIISAIKERNRQKKENRDAKKSDKISV